MKTHHQRFRDAISSLKEISIRVSDEGLSQLGADDSDSHASSKDGEVDRDFATFMLDEDDEGW